MFISRLDFGINRTLNAETFSLKENKTEQEKLIKKISNLNITEKNKLKNICNKLVITLRSSNFNDNLYDNLSIKEVMHQLNISVASIFTENDAALFIALCTHKHNPIFSTKPSYPKTLQNIFEKAGISTNTTDLNILTNDMKSINRI